MTVLDDAARLTHLGLAVRLREGAVQPIITAASLLPAGARILVGASAHGSKLDIVMPFEPRVFAKLVPDARPPGSASNTMLHAQVDGDAIAVALATSGNVTPEAAVTELAPAAHRAAWLDLVLQLTAIANARIVGRTRFVDGSRVSLHVRYPQRDIATEHELMAGVDQLAEDIGVTGPQRRLWAKIHPELGQRNEISIATACLPSGVSSHFAVTYPVHDWDVGMRVATGVVLNDSEAKAVAATLGALAGAVGNDTIQSLEIVLGPHEPPDVIVWVYVGPA